MDVKEIARKTLESAISDFHSIFASSNWTELGVRDEVKGFQKTEGERVFAKGEGFIKLAPDKIADFLWDQNSRKGFIDDLETLEHLHEFEDIKIIHEIMKLPWPLSKREIIMAVKKVKQDEDYFIVGRSVNIGIKEDPNIVRADSFLRAYHLKNVKNIATKVTYINSGIPGGNIPTFVINQGLSRQAFLISKIRSLVIR